MKKELEKDFSHYLQTYGDLVFDFIHSLVPDPETGQIFFREILQKLKTQKKKDAYHRYEKAWVMRIACETLLDQHDYFRIQSLPEQRIQLDAQPPAVKMTQFETYFHRLDLMDQMLLLLKDKMDFTYAEIASILSTPEGSLKVRRQQALRTLEEWLWNTK